MKNGSNKTLIATAIALILFWAAVGVISFKFFMISAEAGAYVGREVFANERNSQR